MVFFVRALLCTLGCLCSWASATSSQDVLDIIFMADIGHPREHADTLTTPWPMDKCAYEGAFSLYEGLLDYVANQGVRPQSIFVLGDNAYCGGDAACNNQTRDAFQKYTQSVVPPNRVYPLIGNHDVHYLGCSKGEEQPGTVSATAPETVGPCHYGTAKDYVKSAWQMTFEQWRTNWLTSFPGLAENVILPPPSSNSKAPSEWLPPLRYNIDFGSDSRVYFVAGLISGVWATIWNNDTIPSAVEATANDHAAEIECRFLRDSLAHGRRLGKSVFIYMTHHFDQGCKDWDVLQQIDIWLYGHKHNQWQTPEGLSTQMKEHQYYPIRLLVGNGGFDEGKIDVVSFGRLREEHVKSSSGDRVRLHFDILDTCQAPVGTCPSSRIGLLAHCWDRCQNISVGYDGGGGPRRASPSAHKMGFVYEAPLKQQPAAKRNLWNIRVGNGTKAQWVGIGECGVVHRCNCLIGVDNASQAVSLGMYDTVYAADNRSLTTRIVIDDKLRAPVISDDDWIIQNYYGYWDTADEGIGQMRPSDGFKFQFTDDWKILGVRWDDDYRLRIELGQKLDVQWHLVDERLQVVV